MFNIFIRKLNLKVVIFFLLFIFAVPTSASTLYFDPSVGSLGPSNTFALDILLDVDECVNTIEADLSFPSKDIQLQDFIIGESILSIWLEQPKEDDISLANQTGILNFSGGIPGGYCGKIPGDPGRSNTVARLIFKVNDSYDIENKKDKINFLFLPSTRVLLNDGFGTTDALITRTASFKYVDKKVDISDDWRKQIDDDTIAPEPFIIELRQNKNMFNNQYYIIFNTVDKQSGLDHFEVLEIRHDQEIGVVHETFWDKFFGKTVSAPKWEIAEIPYLLKDQELLSTIRVKAIDKAGNERFVEYIPPAVDANSTTNDFSDKWFIVIVIAIVSFILFITLTIFIRKIILNKNNKEE